MLYLLCTFPCTTLLARMVKLLEGAIQLFIVCVRQ